MQNYYFFLLLNKLKKKLKPFFNLFPFLLTSESCGEVGSLVSEGLVVTGLISGFVVGLIPGAVVGLVSGAVVGLEVVGVPASLTGEDLPLLLPLSVGVQMIGVSGLVLSKKSTRYEYLLALGTPGNQDSEPATLWRGSVSPIFFDALSILSGSLPLFFFELPFVSPLSSLSESELTLTCLPLSLFGLSSLFLPLLPSPSEPSALLLSIAFILLTSTLSKGIIDLSPKVSKFNLSNCPVISKERID
jgi:hypothetical protein